MSVLEPPSETAPAPQRDLLFNLQLRVARRADELARGQSSSRSRDLAAWFDAEREVFRERADAETAGAAK